MVKRLKGRKKGRGSAPGRQSTSVSAAATPTTVTQELLAIPTREGLTYAEAQKMVEFEVDGRITRVNIYDQLPVISKEKYEATYGSLDSMTMGTSAPLEEKVSLPEPCYTVLDSYNISDAPPRPNAYIRFIERSAEELDGEVEYDMDEEDAAWLSIINERRAAAGLCEVPVDTFELLMDRLEKESYFQMQSSGKSGDGSPPTVIDDDAVCCICMDGECQNSNVILFCDMCNLAVHQDCYGVPYIPEGQWLCRRCLQSPSRAVDCVLCPNNGGAFKQTDRGHWAHVVCALWIPEVRFANTVFLEPIDSIETIPPARWKLTCYICKQRGVGACIQCHKTNCYAAFHVTCAQQAGLYMKMDTVRDATTGVGLDPGPVLVQKTAFCDTHTPSDADSRPRIQSSSQSPGSEGNSSPGSGRDKMKKARRLLAKKRSSLPIISIPTIPPERIQEIASLVSLPKKSQLIQRLIAYWTLKRQFRNGVPLLRRLQSSHLARREDSRPLQEVVSDAGELYRQLKFWQCLRQDLERARLLCELVRKREKLKKEFTKVKELCLRLELWPREWMMLRLLDLIQAKDSGDIFSEPVDPSEVPDYAEVVKNPMDISTMRLKAQSFQYQNLDTLEADFNLMISNCMAYNSRDTIFYRAAIKMRDQGGALIRQARRDMEATGFDAVTGLLLPQGQTGGEPEQVSKQGSTGSSVATNVTVPTNASTEESLAAEIDRQVAEVMERLDHMASRDALARLLELLDRSQRLRHGLARAKRTRFIKAEIAKLRRRMALGAGLTSGSSAGALTTSSARLSNATGAVLPAASEGEDGFESDTEREDTTDEEVVAKSAKSASAAIVPAKKTSSTTPASKSSFPEKPARPQARRTTASSTASSAASCSTAATREHSIIDSSKESSEETSGAPVASVDAPSRVALPPASSVTPKPPASAPSKRGRRRKTRGKRPRESSIDDRSPAPASTTSAVSASQSTSSAPPLSSSPHGVSKGAANAATSGAADGVSATASNTPLTPLATAAAGGSPTTSDAATAGAGLGTSTVQSQVLTTSAPTTPAKLGVSSDHQAQMTVSPSGVNRRTAVLFTRKAQAAAAFRRPDLPGSSTPMTPASAPPPTNKRRVGRPRKNLDAALSSRVSEPPSLLSGADLSSSTGSAIQMSTGNLAGGLDKSNASGAAGLSLSSSPLPFTESFRVYRQGGDIPAETDEDTQSDSSCSSCSSTDGSSGSSGGASSSLDLHHPSGGESSAEEMEVTAATASAPRGSSRDTAVSGSGGATGGTATGNVTAAAAATTATTTTTMTAAAATASSTSASASGTIPPAGDSSALEPLDMVWAKCRGYPWYPALIIDPKMRAGYLHNGVPIPAPPVEVLNLASNYDEPVYLVLFFDTKRTWQWLPRNKLERLGLSTEMDQSKLIESRKPTERKAVRKAYQEAMTHRCQVAGGNRRGRGSGTVLTATASDDI